MILGASHKGPFACKDIHSRLRTTFTNHDFKQFLKVFKENDCPTIGYWLRLFAADVVLFIEMFKKTAMQYYPNKTGVCKNAVSITGISMTKVLNKSLENGKKIELYA